MTPEQKRVYDAVQSGLTLRQAAKTLCISYDTARGRYRRAQKWVDADPSAQIAATAAGANVVPHSYWIKKDGVSAYFKTPQQADEQESLIERVAEAFKHIPAYVERPSDFTMSELLSLYILTDAHIGMYAWEKETGGQSYDVDLAERDICDSFTAVTSLVPSGGEAVLILNGDTLHADNSDNQTPASKHILDVDGRQFKILDAAIRSIAWVIEHLLTKHEKVKVRVSRGNHDQNAHHILTFALAERYRDTGRVTVVKDPNELFMIRHGSVLIASEHGDRAKAETFVHKVADVCPYWSDAPFRYGFSGHVHKHQVSRIGGMLWHSLDAFCPVDSYSSRFPGRRNQSAMVFCKERGLILTANDPIIRVSV